EHRVELGDPSLEVVDAGGMADQHADECGDVEAEPAAVEDRVVPGDHAGALELLDALEDRRGAEAHLLAQADERRAAVLLQQAEKPAIDVVEIAGGVLT